MGNKNAKNKYQQKLISMMENIYVRKKQKSNSIFVINNVLSVILIVIKNMVIKDLIHQTDIEIKKTKYLQFKKGTRSRLKSKINKNQK